MHATPRAMLQIENLCYRIGPRVLLDAATAAVPVGHRVGLVGRNGTGKTTLLKLIMQELTPDSGVDIHPAALAHWRHETGSALGCGASNRHRAWGRHRASGSQC